MPSIKIALIALLILLQSCSLNQNDDNEIYIPGREFHYVIHYTDSTYAVLKIDSLVLKATDGFYPQQSQTAIDWIHYQTSENDTTVVKETTGVVDSKGRYFIHPPREGDLHILSFAEFPTINTSVFKDTTSKTNSSGSVTMAKTYKGKAITNVETTQEYQGKIAIDIPFKKNYHVHHLRATAKSELGTIFGNYYFSEQLGFVRLDYELPDKTGISIQLSGINFEISTTE
jgi:hypothetical protein